MKSHILLFTENMATGGLATHILGQASHLKALGIRVTIFCPHEEIPLYASAVEPLTFSKFDSAGTLRSEIDNLAKFVTDESVTHIHAHGPVIGIFASLLAQKTVKPLYLSFHSNFSVIRRVNITISLLIENFVIPSATKIFAVSQEIAGLLEENYPEHTNKVYLTENGVNNWQNNSSSNNDDPKGQWAFVSRLDEYHIASLRHVTDNLDQLPIEHLHIFGEGPHDNEAVKMAKTSPNEITYHGPDPEIAKKLSGYEGIVCYGGRVFLEAAAAGRPCLVTHETGLMGLSSPEFIHQTRPRNYTGRGRDPVTLDALNSVWGDLTTNENVEICQTELESRHNGEKVWELFANEYMLSDKTFEATDFGVVLADAISQLNDGNELFIQHHLLAIMKQLAKSDASFLAALNSAGFDLMTRELKLLSRHIRELKAHYGRT
jgi:hypothetical protein